MAVVVWVVVGLRVVVLQVKHHKKLREFFEG